MTQTDSTLRVWDDWEPRLQLQNNFVIVENGARRFVNRKQLHTKKFGYDEALFLMHEKCALRPITEEDRPVLQSQIEKFEASVEKADDRKEAIATRKETGKAARKVRLEKVDRIQKQKEGYDLFDVFDENGEIIDKPFVEMSNAELYLDSKKEKEPVND